MASPVPFQTSQFRPTQNVPLNVAPDDGFYNSGNINNNNMQWRGGHNSTIQFAQQQQQQQQPQQKPLGPKIGTGFNPPPQNFLNDFSDNPMAGYAVNQASTFLQAQSQRYMPGAYGLWGSLKYYFQVNNSYVLNKLKIILLPFRHKNWMRMNTIDYGPGSGAQNNTPKFIPPVNDINAPDLYIPLMSFITYILIVGYVKGTSGEFSPSVIGEVGTYCLCIQMIEIILIKFTLHLLNSSISFWDTVSCTGYKYVALVINMSVGVLLGRMLYYVSLLYTGLMSAFFVMNCLKGSIPDPGLQGKKRRNYLLLGVAAIQFLLIWWNGYLEKVIEVAP